MALTRRGFLRGAAGAGAGAVLLRHLPAAAQHEALLERNKAVVLHYKKAQGSAEEAAVMRATVAPGATRHRAGFLHLAANAQGQDFPSPGVNLRAAIPDRVDVIEDIIADGNQVGLLFRVTGTHAGNFYGIPASGRRIDVLEAALFTLENGLITESWFMADEAALLKQLQARLPPRKDGRIVAPPVTDAGIDGDTLLARISARPAQTEAERNKLIVARSKASNPPPDNRAPDYRQLRQGFQHLRDYGIATRTEKETPTSAFPDRRDFVDALLGEGDRVWMQFRLRGTHTRPLYGVAPTGRRVDVAEIGIMRFGGGQWRQGWYFGDELGMLLQLGVPNLLSGG
jgi:predicted ester cyclase